jgi:hypothetical protein
MHRWAQLYIKWVEEQNEPDLKNASLKEWLTGHFPQYFPVQYYYIQLKREKAGRRRITFPVSGPYQGHNI